MTTENAGAFASSPAAIILASGMSRRFRGSNKLLLPAGGIPLVRRVVQAYVAESVTPVYVVVGFEADQVVTALSGLPVNPVWNPHYALGQSRALVRGIQALPASTGAVLIGVADQPYLTAGVIRAIVDRFRTTDAPIVAPRYDGQRGNPVLFRADLFPELLAVEGDEGGRSVIGRHAPEVEWVDFDDGTIGVDIDTGEEEDYLRRLESGE